MFGFLRGKKKNVFTDHGQYFSKLFAVIPVKNFLEFGLGEGTRFFLDNCQRVMSVELATGPMHSPSSLWFEKCQNMYANYQSWTPLYHECGDSLSKADQIARVEKIHPATKDGDYLHELRDLVDTIFAENSFDLAFVDCGIHTRGDIVNLLFDKVDIIAAHDFNDSPEVYGWDIIKVPSNYKMVRFSKGQGTVFLVKENHWQAIASLRNVSE
ncbi:MAG: hypothetical protein OEV91_04035 [Desulfobulbaceae bacterium]|nr:hypothetical protein [Desulfobulbaceae bacterium]